MPAKAFSMKGMNRRILSRYLLEAILLTQTWAFPPNEFPPYEENFDPALANTDGQIICDGPLPPWPLPWSGGWNPEGATLQQICAKPQYGGRLPFREGGKVVTGNSGFCWREVMGGRRGRDPRIYPSWVAFDNDQRYYPTGSGTLSNPRMQSYCVMRCYCASAQHLSPIRRLDEDPQLFHQLQKPEDSMGVQYQIELDRYDDFKTAVRHIKDFHATYVQRISSGQETDLMADEWAKLHGLIESLAMGAKSSKTTVVEVSYHPDHRPICTGALPDFPFPGALRMPLELHRYLIGLTPQKVCAATLLGGHKAYNAGAYCYRQNAEEWDEASDEDKTSQLWFSLEVTPDVLWNPEYDYRFPLQVQYYCHQRCRCPYDVRDQQKPDILDDIFMLTGSLAVAGNSYLNDLFLRNNFPEATLAESEHACNGENGYLPTNSQCASNRSTYQIIPGKIINSHGFSMECGIPGTPVCPPEPWPSAMFGPKPGLSPPSREDQSTCGSSCSGPAATNCSGYEAAGGKGACKCVLLRHDLASLLGLKSVGMMGRCITSAALAAAVAVSRSRQGRLGGRSDVAWGDTEWSCFCKSGTASPDCCDDSIQEAAT